MGNTNHTKGGDVRAYMRAVIEEHRDLHTGEVNLTALAEDAAQHCDWYEGNDVPEPFFEWAYAVDVGVTRRAKGGIPPTFGGLVSAYDHVCGRG